MSSVLIAYLIGSSISCIAGLWFVLEYGYSIDLSEKENIDFIMSTSVVIILLCIFWPVLILLMLLIFGNDMIKTLVYQIGNWLQSLKKEKIND